MSAATLSQCLFAAGLLQFSVLIASALVPIRLDWKKEFASLSPLHRQMYWVYGGYVVLSIIAFGVITTCNARELAAGSQLARFFCGYVAVFWGVRISLQPILQVKPHLKTWWLTLGYHSLTFVFLYLTTIFAWSALRPAT
jgi:hypothetical protein